MKRKNCLGLTPVLHALVRTPSATSTRPVVPWTAVISYCLDIYYLPRAASLWPDTPKHSSMSRILWDTLGFSPMVTVTHSAETSAVWPVSGCFNSSVLRPDVSLNLNIDPCTTCAAAQQQEAAAPGHLWPRVTTTTSIEIHSPPPGEKLIILLWSNSEPSFATTNHKRAIVQASRHK